MTTPDRKHCTANNPMPADASRVEWVHLETQDVGEEINGLRGGGDYDIRECPHCRRRFYVEVPD